MANKFTKEESKILKMFTEGKVNGLSTDMKDFGKSSYWYEIVDGVVYYFKMGPGSKFFDGKESIRKQGKQTVVRKWVSPEELIEFVRKFGWLFNNTDFKKYSAKFKPAK